MIVNFTPMALFASVHRGKTSDIANLRLLVVSTKVRLFQLLALAALSKRNKWRSEGDHRPPLPSAENDAKGIVAAA